VVGNNNYQNLKKLESAKSDAIAVADLLIHLYGFKIDLLLDATRADILIALQKMGRDLSTNDNLLVYYAGHGWLDQDAGGERNHSLFAAAFLKALQENTEILDGNQLFDKIRRPVMLNSDQTPEYSDIRKAGHNGGDPGRL
jgi:uncharacterized caspase-like protein